MFSQKAICKEDLEKKQSKCKEELTHLPTGYMKFFRQETLKRCMEESKQEFENCLRRDWW